MATLDQLLLLVSGLGGLHGLFLAAYLFFRPQGAWSNRFLAGLILVVSIRVLKSVFFYFNPAIGKQILQLGLSACFMIGPLLFCYTQHYLGVARETWALRLHWLVPLVLVVTVGLVYPYHLYPELWGGPFYRAINYSWLAYTVLSLAFLLPKLGEIRRDQWPQELDLLIVVAIALGSGLVCAAYFFSSYTSYIAGALSFSFLICVGLLAAFLRVSTKRPELAEESEQAELPTPETPSPYANKKIAEEDAAPLIVELEKFMAEQKAYLDANLTLTKLAKMLTWSAPKLSQLLNDNLQKSFNEYVNAYRIEYAKTLLTGDAAMKMEDLAERSGFNSLSTFYAAFKKHTQLTPAKYKALQENGNSEIINP